MNRLAALLLLVSLGACGDTANEDSPSTTDVANLADTDAGVTDGDVNPADSAAEDTAVDARPDASDDPSRDTAADASDSGDGDSSDDADAEVGDAQVDPDTDAETDAGDIDGGASADAPDGLDAGRDSLTVTFSLAPDSATVIAASTFEFAAPGASAYVCALDDEPEAPCESPAFFVPMLMGSHRLSVAALDESGERGAASTHEWTIESIVSETHPDIVVATEAPDPVAPGSWRGISRMQCDLSHTAYNDPIVRPGVEHGAHLHSFYGNAATDHTTTFQSLYESPASTCQGNSLNASSYWVPALLAPAYDADGDRVVGADGEEWEIVDALAGGGRTHELFYYSAGIDDLDAIQNVPPGLRMIAGDASTTPSDPEQDTGVARWHCRSWNSRDSAGGPWSSTIPRCEVGDQVRFDIFFPSCWDGERLDSDDHQRHMAYPVTTGAGPASATECPDSHPVPLIRPSYHYAFLVTAANADPVAGDSRNWRLAADDYTVALDNPGGLSLHGDWFNGWHPEVLRVILENCIRGERDCHDGNLGNGLQLGQPPEGVGVAPDVINGGRGGH